MKEKKELGIELTSSLDDYCTLTWKHGNLVSVINFTASQIVKQLNHTHRCFWSGSESRTIHLNISNIWIRWICIEWTCSHTLLRLTGSKCKLGRSNIEGSSGENRRSSGTAEGRTWSWRIIDLWEAKADWRRPSCWWESRHINWSKYLFLILLQLLVHTYIKKQGCMSQRWRVSQWKATKPWKLFTLIIISNFIPIPTGWCVCYQKTLVFYYCINMPQMVASLWRKSHDVAAGL